MSTLPLYRESIDACRSDPAPRFDGDAARHLGLYAYNVAARFFPGRPHLVEEAVQEALTRTCEHWARAIRSGNAEAWVVNTATNVCHEKLREETRGARPSIDLGRPADGGDDIVSRALLSGALRRLSTRQRVVVVWRYVFDRSVIQTATELGLSESKVRDASHNGVKRLQRLLGEQWSEMT